MAEQKRKILPTPYPRGPKPAISDITAESFQQYTFGGPGKTLQNAVDTIVVVNAHSMSFRGKQVPMVFVAKVNI